MNINKQLILDIIEKYNYKELEKIKTKLESENENINKSLLIYYYKLTYYVIYLKNFNRFILKIKKGEGEIVDFELKANEFIEFYKSYLMEDYLIDFKSFKTKQFSILYINTIPSKMCNFKNKDTEKAFLY